MTVMLIISLAIPAKDRVKWLELHHPCFSFVATCWNLTEDLT